MKTIRFAVSNWPGHLPGQHADVRLTAEDGYRAERSYSIASPPEASALELTVERLDDGEVSPFLTGQLQPDDTIQLRGPIGGYFVWSASERRRPLLLVGGGSGIVPLMCMLRHRRLSGSAVPRSTPVLGPHPRGSDLPRGAHGSRTQRSPVHASDDADAGFCTGLVRSWSGVSTCQPSRRCWKASAEWLTASSAVPPDSWRRRLPCCCRRDNRRDAIRTERFGPTGTVAHTST